MRSKATAAAMFCDETAAVDAYFSFNPTFQRLDKALRE
jgi:hypothetical protein